MAGFFDSLKESVKGIADSFKGLVGSYAETNHYVNKGIYDLATGAFDSHKDIGPAWDDMSKVWESGQKSGAATGSFTGSLIDSNPLTRNLAAGAEWAYREGVSRPLSTTVLQSSVAEQKGENAWAALFDGDAWGKAYQLSKRISPGQAIVGQYSEGEDGVATPDQILSALDEGKFDEGGLKWTSGAVDAAGRMFLDPTILGGKVAGVARLRYVKPLTAEKVVGGAATKYTLSQRFARVEKVVQNADSADEIRVRLLNDNSNGAAVATVLHAVRHDPELLRIATRAAYGEGKAFDDLAAYNESLIAAKGDAAPGMQAAADLGRLRRGDPAVVRRQRVGTNGEELGDWDDYVNLMKADQNVFDQAVTLSPELMADVRSAPLASTGAVALPAMRDSLSSRLRFSLHQQAFSSAQPSLVRAPLESITRTWLTPSNRRIHGINLVDDNSDKALRSYMDRAGLPREQQTPLLDRYMAATGNASQRMLVTAQAEESVIRHMGRMYGHSTSDVNEIVTKASRGAGRARYLLANRHEFMSENVASGLAENGKVISWIDEDGTRQMMPVPVLESQLMDVYPVADPGQLHTAMKNAASPTRNAASRITNDVSASMDAVHRLWKPTVLLGLGWPVRALSDEVGRSVALFGLGSQVLGVGKGFVHSASNIAERGGIRWDAYVNGRNRDRLQTLARVMDPEVPATNRFIDLAHAYSEGHLTTKELTSTAADAAKRGLGDPLTAGLWRSVEDRTMTRAEFDNEVVTRALSKNEKNWFMGPFNQRGILNQVRDEGKASFDPMTGEPYKPGAGTKVVKSAILKPDKTGLVPNDALHDFVRSNLDHVIHGDAGVTLTRLADGTVKADAHAPHVGVRARRQIAKRELKELPARAARSANKPVRVKLAPGESMEFEGVFEGAGDRYRKMASSDDVYNNWMAEKHELTRDRVAASAGWSNAIKAGSSPDYPAAWERAANLQLGNDRAAQQFLAGLNFDAVKHWAMEPGGDGQNWARSLAFTGDIDTRLSRVQAMVDSYVPDVGDLRQKVLDQRATFDDLHKVVPDDSLKPQVHGELLDYNMGGSQTLALVRKQTHKLMEKLGTIPGDKFSRYPFLDKSYRDHLESMAKIEFGERGTITQARRRELQEAARKRALGDVKKWLYNSDMVSEGSSLIRHLSPFSAAWQDGMRAWSGIAFRERPATAGYIYNLWQAPERAGLIVDQDGRELKVEAGGKEVWLEHEIDPETGKETGKVTRVTKKPDDNSDRYVQIPLPSWLSPDQIAPGAKLAARINKNSFNTFMHLDPGAGPIATVPTSAFIQKYHPDWGENDIVKRILPFGPTANPLKNAMSNELRQVYENWQGEADSVFRNQAMMIFQAETVKYNQGERTTKPTFDEAADKATSLKLMRTVLTSVLPVSPTFTSPYQAHIDAYRQLEAKDPSTADAKFYERFGDDFFILTARVTKGVKGLPPTLESYRAIEKYRSMIEKYPEVAGAIVGDVGGAFNKAVYEWQKQERISTGGSDKFRELMDMRDSVEDVAARASWMKYQSVSDVIHAELSDRGLTDVNVKGAEDLKELKDGVVAQLGFDEQGMPTKWYEDYTGSSEAKKAKTIAGLRVVAQDPTLMNREDIQGLADYFVMRDEFKGLLQARDDAGKPKTLAAKKNADIAAMWQEAVFNLKDSNLAFSSLYDRYLTSDELKV